MSFGGVEMGVSRHNVALVHQVGEEYIFGSASLVGGDNVFKSGEAVMTSFSLKNEVAPA